MSHTTTGTFTVSAQQAQRLQTSGDPWRRWLESNDIVSVARSNAKRRLALVSLVSSRIGRSAHGSSG